SNSDISSLSTFLKSHNQLSRNIHETCSQFGAAHRWGPGENDTGMNRLALTDADKAVRDWFVEEARGLGCEVEVHEMGNIWAVRHGVSDLSPESSREAVKFSLDIRSPSDHTLVSFESRLRKKFDVIAAERPGFSGLPCSVTWQEDTNSPSQGFDEGCIKAVKESALSVLGAETGDIEQALRLVNTHMVSGAGHDSVNTAKRCPTSMIFVPSKGGLSHHPEEFTSEEDCVRGAQVLLESVLRFDREVWREDFNREKAGEQLELA
ncbi:SET domain-containing protein 5, partial [Neurospora sp. IMI 360204]